MNKVIPSSFLILISTLTINGDMFKELQVDGYLRSAYEIHAVKGDDTFKDGAIGGKVHIETSPYLGVQFGTSFYTSNALGYSDNGGLVPFRGEVANSYTILGEAYIHIAWDNAAFSVFGGGPFFANSEYLILDNAVIDGEQTNIGITWDTTSIGI